MILFRPLIAAGLLAFAAALPASASASANPPEDYRAVYRDLVGRHADAVVTMKFVMSVTSSGNEQRIEDRTQAVMVSADGLLLVPERAVSVDFGALGNATPGQASPVATSSDFRVRLADSEDWLPADLVTRDGELGLAWLRLRNPPGRLAFVDLARGVGPEPGMRFFSLLRTSDDWGAVPVFRPGLVLGETRNPTFRLLVDGVPGLAFAHDGRPMGYVDIDLAAVSRQRGTGLGLDFADMALRMTPIDKVAAATVQAARLPAAGR